ncbi:MAG: deoxynucleoside kinase [Deltaproteobacteria bacterium]|nr:deoxynucleoside kinase [Deltaproteobacteria bacterium]
MTTPHRYIAVDGAIGVGKTTLVRMLAQDLGGRAVLEPVEKNPFLADFYKDRRRNAFKTQLFFLLNRYQQQIELQQQDLFHTITICDYTFAKDRIFAQLNLGEDELVLYDTVFNLLDTRLPKPDLVVYLQASTEVMKQRTKQRKMPAERNISEEYLEQLAEAYNRFFFTYTTSPLLVVNATDLDFVKNPTDWENLRNAILEHGQGTAHYHYIGDTGS